MNKDQNIEQDTERKIMEAAAKVFMQKGRLGASMQDIADEAGINRTLLHYYFRNKEKLFDTIFEKLFSKIFPAMVQALASDLPFLEKIEIFAETYANLLNENPFLPVFVFQEISINPDRIVKRIENLGIESEKTKWIQKYAAMALNSWHSREHLLEVSEEYRLQLEIDMATQYDNLLKRKFIEAMWAN